MLDDATVMSLRCFIAVVESQSFSSAARQLRLAPSTVTKHVKHLETALKTALLHRSTRRVSVTGPGERFYIECVDILRQIDNATALVVEEQQLSGHLRVTVPPSFAATVLGPSIQLFMERYPGVSLEIMVTGKVPDLIRDRIDLALTLRHKQASKLTHILLATSAAMLCASPEYISRHGAPVEPEDLKGHICLASRLIEPVSTWVMRRGGDWRSIQVDVKVSSDNGDFLRQACLHGAGIGIFYSFHVSADLESGRLITVMPDYEIKPLNVYAIVPHRQIVHPLTDAFIKFLLSLIDTASIN